MTANLAGELPVRFGGRGEVNPLSDPNLSAAILAASTC